MLDENPAILITDDDRDFRETLREVFEPRGFATLLAADGEEAIQIVNDTGYGLTSGLESLDDREQELWQEAIRAGNLYITDTNTNHIRRYNILSGYVDTMVGGNG